MTVFAFFCIIIFFRDNLSNLRNYLRNRNSLEGEFLQLQSPRKCFTALTALSGAKKSYFLKYWAGLGRG
jgi:hypothetical protein